MLSSAGLLSSTVTRAALLGVFGVVALQPSAHAQAPWPTAGGNISNTHAYLSPVANVGLARQLNPSTVKNLKVKWQFATQGDISATPTVEPGGLYVPDWAGYLYKINPVTGAQVWSKKVCEYTSTCYTAYTSISRTAPAIATNTIIIGDAIAHPNVAKYGALVIGVNKATGAKAWQTVVNNTSTYASVLGSPVIYNNVVYVGTASWDEGVAGSNPNYVPTFRGNVTALDPDTGAILRQFTTVPAGYTGGPIPGSTMAIWPAQNALLIATGNNYSVPSSVASCVGIAGSDVKAQIACLDPTNYVNSLLSLDLNTFSVKWGRRMSGADAWVLGCPNQPNCPKPTGTDSDFAQGPMLAYVPNFSASDDLGGTAQNMILGAGQKNSQFYGVNPLNGGLLWRRYVGTGGMEWGSAVNVADHNHFYFALHNPQRVRQTIVGKGGTNPQSWDAGAWGALDIRTGTPSWTVPVVGHDLLTPARNASAPGCVTFANRVLFAGASSGVMSAIDATTGYNFWNFESGGTVVSCPAIFDETVYWGTGYKRYGVGKHMLYAFSVNGV